MSRQRGAAPAPATVTLTVPRVQDVFAPPPIADFPVSVTLPARIEEVVDDLLARHVREPVDLTVELTEQEPGPVAQAELEGAVRAYCEARIRHARRTVRSVRRQGVEVLPIGIIVLLVGTAASHLLLRSHLPEPIREFFGDGVFVLVAWVALWYPLDQLVYYWRPHQREQRALEALRDGTVVVRAAARAD